MIPGVSYPSWRSGAVFALVSGTADADYPVTNLGDLRRIRTVFRTTGAGAIQISAVLSADQDVQFVALVHHNAPAAATWRIRSYDDAGMTSLVDDSGTVAFAGAGSFPQVTPYRLASALTVRAVLIDLSDLGAAWEIGGVEIAGFWDLSSISSMSRGLKAQDFAQEVGDGVTHATRQFSPRIATLGLEVIDTETDGKTLLDLQAANGLSEPFVWTRAADLDTTYEREAMLVRLSGLTPLTKSDSFIGSIGLPLVEHLL